jgi:DNA-binding transcriptional ArsR family regulator
MQWLGVGQDAMPVLFFARSSHDRNQRDVMFRAIGDPTRREILSLLRGVWRAAGEIAGDFRTSGRRSRSTFVRTSLRRLIYR